MTVPSTGSSNREGPITDVSEEADRYDGSLSSGCGTAQSTSGKKSFCLSCADAQDKDDWRLRIKGQLVCLKNSR